MISTTRVWRSAALIALAGLALAACGGSSSGSSGSSGASGGSAGKTLIISSDLPLRRLFQADASAAMNNAIKLYLTQVGNKAGKYKVSFKSYDDSTAAAGKYDDATCAKNAQDHVANADEVAVMGTYNSGRALLGVPVPNQGPQRSDADGLARQHQPWSDQGLGSGRARQVLPGPSGQRKYARIVTTDDFQGTADSNFVFQDLGKKRCYASTTTRPTARALLQRLPPTPRRSD